MVNMPHYDCHDCEDFHNDDDCHNDSDDGDNSDGDEKNKHKIYLFNLF